MLEIYEELIEGLLDKGFHSVDNWFTKEELDCLRQSLLQHYQNDDFHSAGIGNKDNLQEVKKIRKDHIYWLDKENASACEQSFLDKVDGFIQHLNRTCYTGIASHELHYAVYEEGAYYKKHVDKFKNDDRRIFSIVFYITEEWKTGDGGELLVYSLEDDTITAKIEPRPGRMIFFNSDIPHEVTTSKKQRLSLTGWMKRN